MPSKQKSSTRKVPVNRPFFFKDAGTDQLLAMLLTLSSEVWALRERLAALETVAAKKGVLLPRELDTWEFTAEQLADLAAMRKDFLGSLFAVLDEQPGLKRSRSWRGPLARKKMALKK